MTSHDDTLARVGLAVPGLLAMVRPLEKIQQYATELAAALESDGQGASLRGEAKYAYSMLRAALDAADPQRSKDLNKLFTITDPATGAVVHGLEGLPRDHAQMMMIESMAKPLDELEVGEITTCRFASSDRGTYNVFRAQ